MVVLVLMLLAAAMTASFALAKGALSACENTDKPSFCATGEEPRQAFPKKIEF